jgi:hypothetical protein
MASAVSASTSRLFDDMIENDFDNTGLYCPDFSITRLPTKKSTRRITNGWNTYDQDEITIIRPSSDDRKLVPITEVDAYIHNKDLRITETNIILHKHGMFDTIHNALETYATDMTESYDPRINMFKRKYTVPVIGFLTCEKRDTSFGTDSAYFKTKMQTYYRSDYTMSQPRERFIIIDGDKYSKWKIYRRISGRLVPLHLPTNYDFNAKAIVNDGEQTFRVAKTTISKSHITMTFPADVQLSGLSIHPEKLKFESIHSSTIHCHGKCTKPKHCISCLDNDPCFVMSFKISIRSSLTDGWIPYGTFSGNTSIFDSTRISFDPIMVKEMRIIPTNYHRAFDKIELFPIGPSISTTPTSDNTFVTYTLTTPRDGKYLNQYDKCADTFCKYISSCNCGLCSGRRSGKGTYKELCRMMHDVLDVDV